MNAKVLGLTRASDEQALGEHFGLDGVGRNGSDADPIRLGGQAGARVDQVVALLPGLGPAPAGGGGGGDGPGFYVQDGQVLLGAIFLVPVVVVTTALGAGDIATPIAASTTAGMLALGGLGSGIAYVLNTRIVMVAGGTVASSVTYITPLVAVVVGVAFLGEPLTWHEPVGGLIVLLGVAVAQGRIRLPARRGSMARQAAALPLADRTRQPAPARVELDRR